VKLVELVIDPHTGRFTGVVNVDYGSELDAKKACTGMIGLRIDNHVLDVRKIASLESGNANGTEGEMFR
jgi:hypothetical protein